jgi:hypothetical protein
MVVQAIYDKSDRNFGILLVSLELTHPSS